MTEEIKQNRITSQKKIKNNEYDVYFSYTQGNSKDFDRMIEIGKLLMDNGIVPWITEWDAQPGRPTSASREKQIKKIASAAIFIGQAGFDDRLLEEVDAFLRVAGKKTPVIPVFLPDAPANAQFPSIFLELRQLVDFRKTDPDPLEHLIWGITGKRPAKVYRPGILVASLGDSPVVVSSMYDLLIKKEGLNIDRVMVLRPENHEAQLGYKLIRKTFPSEVELEEDILPFTDANSPYYARVFLQKLYKTLNIYQELGNSVYLSLTGGRKSMAALMAWVAPFFSCVKKLYHVIDNHESDKGNDHFLSAYQLDGRSSALHMHLMHPNPDDLSLVTIPFERGQQISRKLIAQLNMLESGDEKADYEKDEALITGQTAFQEEAVLKVSVTDLVIKQFNELRDHNRDAAHIVRNGLLAMSKSATLQQHKTDSDTYRFKAAKMDPANLHYFTGLPISIQPIFYTRPGDIYSETDEPIERVVICSLEREDTNGYRALKDMKKDTDFSLKYSASVDALPPLPSPAESMLIVPLGKFPMVATQLYTLLTEQEKHTIHEVVLIYPEEEEIVNGARLIQRAFADKHIPYKPVCIKGLSDIKSKEDCELYQSCIESEIDRVQQEYPKYKIDLALSGGRKGMTAMTIFAAQKKRIPYVYHTLITDEDLNEKIDVETTFAELNRTGLSRQELYDRLFLKAYRIEESYPYEHFTLFKVPVFSPDGW